MEFIARGELAKQILEEIQRPATKKEIDVLRRAMKNRIPRRKVDERMRMEKINTYNMVLAVCFNGTSVIVDHGGIEQSSSWFDGSCFCEDAGFVENTIPKETGVYNCKVEHEIWGGEEPEWEFRVMESHPIYSDKNFDFRAIKTKPVDSKSFVAKMRVRETGFDK